MDHLSRAEIQRLLSEARKHRERDWVMLLITYWHGLRASEVLNLTAANFRGGFLTVQRLKGSRRTTQPLIEHSVEILNERAAVESWVSRHPEGKLFPVSRVQFWRLMQLYCSRSGIPPHKAHPHVLKHSIAMQMIARTGIQHVRQYLGHKSISSTGHYIEENDETASAALARAETQETDTQHNRFESLGNISMAETLRRLLRQVEQGETRKKRRKA